VGVITAAGMQLFEILKQLLHERITIWESHTVTIVFSTTLASIIAYFVSLRFLRAQRALQSAIQKKETLMLEIQHRVTNSLNIVASLLDLQAETLDSEEGRHALKETRSRIGSMADLYDMLRSTGGTGTVDLADYITHLVEHLAITFIHDRDRTEVSTRIERVHIDMKRAVSIALVLNELITNAVKYAHPDGMAGRIGVMLERSGQEAILTVSDDGVGLPAGFDAGSCRSLGMLLIQALSKQLGASITLEGTMGTRATLRFPL
jgi:two-component sensor histidine kinase